MVCPLRVLLVVFSTVIAGYVAWRTWGSHSSGLSNDENVERLEQVTDLDTHSRPSFRQVIVKISKWLQNTMWAVVDMGSGRYLHTKWSERQRDAGAGGKISPRKGEDGRVRAKQSISCQNQSRPSTNAQ